jgi:hypothetical protein
MPLRFLIELPPVAFEVDAVQLENIQAVLPKHVFKKAAVHITYVNQVPSLIKDTPADGSAPSSQFKCGCGAQYKNKLELAAHLRWNKVIGIKRINQHV